MSEESKSELKEYAGGWITERKETEIPGFLKFVFPVLTIAMIVYLFVYMNGEVNHPDRGPFVQQLNAVTGTANNFMYMVAALIAIYLIILVVFLFKKSHHEE
jgi:Na+/H+ antiporter NhaC